MSTRLSKKTEYLVGANGSPRAVVLDIAEYRKLMSAFEDMEDALTLKRAVSTGKKFVNHKTLVSRLKKAQIL